MPAVDRRSPAPGEPLAGSELAAFAAAVGSGSLHDAAADLDLTQSAVTKRIQRLERRLGVRLLDRSSVGVLPTDAGRAVLPEAQRALGALRAVERAAAAHRTSAATELSIAASHTIGEFLVPGWIRDLARERSDVHARVEIVNSPRVVEAVRAGRVEIGFVEHDDPLDGLECVEVAHDEIVVVVASEHRWAGRTSVASAELAREPYVARESGSGTRTVAETALSAVGIELHPTLEAASTGAVTRALRDGGFSLLSRLVVEDDPDGRLVGIPVRGVPLERALRACHVRGRTPEAAAGVLWRRLAR